MDDSKQLFLPLAPQSTVRGFPSATAPAASVSLAGAPPLELLHAVAALPLVAGQLYLITSSNCCFQYKAVTAWEYWSAGTAGTCRGALLAWADWEWEGGFAAAASRRADPSGTLDGTSGCFLWGPLLRSAFLQPELPPLAVHAALQRLVASS